VSDARGTLHRSGLDVAGMQSEGGQGKWHLPPAPASLALARRANGRQPATAGLRAPLTRAHRTHREMDTPCRRVRRLRQREAPASIN
jgi:hypothetical protein